MRTDNLEQGQDGNADAEMADGEASGCTLTRYTNWLEEVRQQPQWRAEADRESDYYDGNQLDAETLRDMQELGMPPIVENVIAPTVDSVLGLEAKTRTDWKVSADHDNRDQAVADAMNFKLNQAERQTKADRACAEAYAGQIKVGIGWVEVSRESDPFKDPYRALDVHRNEMFWDMRGRNPDTSDWRWLMRRRWTDADIAQAMFPKHKDLIKHVGNAWALYDESVSVDGGRSTDLAMSYDRERGWSIEEQEWRDVGRQRVCLFEVWYRDWVRALILRTPDGRVVEYDQNKQAHVIAVGSGMIKPQYAVFSKVRRAWWLGPHCLHDAPSPYKHKYFGYVPFFGKREDRTGVYYGLIRPMVPMQDEVNARNSKQLWLLSAKRVTRTAGAVLGDDETLRTEVARPDADIVLDPEKMRGGGIFTVESDFALNAQQFQALNDKREGIKRVGGVYNAFMGQNSNATSGAALNTLVDQSAQNLAEINDNYRFARALVGEILLSLVIEDLGNKPHAVEVSGKMPGEEPQRITLNVPTYDQEAGIQYLDNDVQRARLKVALTDVPSTPSFRAQQLMSLAEITKSLPPQVQSVVLPFVLALADIPNRDEIIKAIKEATGQGADIGQQPQVQQLIQQAVQQALVQSGMSIKEAEAKTKQFEAETKSHAAKAKAHADNLTAEAAWLRAETDAGRMIQPANNNNGGTFQ